MGHEGRMVQAQERANKSPRAETSLEWLKVVRRTTGLKWNVQKIKRNIGGFPGGAVVKNPPANAGDTGSSPGPGRSHMPRSN